ncbi:RAD protein [Plasmodium gonderi]|uniref:RAD protein n=1 Tax=Plasmodium gonderi TaxID=77519 RepID=A0A1Y1JC14_PLAGO|nr:RAD protein [Plasmodium gonderi]GAW79780.1 RAD protein [Plasmodium gonderi]
MYSLENRILPGFSIKLLVLLLVINLLVMKKSLFKNCGSDFRCKGKKNPEVELRTCPRILTDVSASNETFPEGIKLDHECDHYVYETIKYKKFLKKLQNHPSNKKEITTDDVNKFLSSCDLFVSKKKARFVFYHYNRYQRKLFKDLSKRMWNKFTLLANENGIPNDIQLKIWKKYYVEIIDHFRKMDNFFIERFVGFLCRSIILNISLYKFLGRYKRTWKENLREQKFIWTMALTNAIKDYPN